MGQHTPCAQSTRRSHRPCAMRVPYPSRDGDDVEAPWLVELLVPCNSRVVTPLALEVVVGASVVAAVAAVEKRYEWNEYTSCCVTRWIRIVASVIHSNSHTTHFLLDSSPS
jgi:hypothetical protein